MTHEQTPKNLPWLDRLAVWVPGYGGYLDRANRRADDRMLREAVAHRLGVGRAKIEEAIRQCVTRGALTEIASLERLQKHLDRVIERIRSAGSGTDEFWQAGHFEVGKVDPLVTLDLGLFERADEFVAAFDAPDQDHDRLSKLEEILAELDRKLDERGLTLQKIR
jgi:hypothetical protein